MARLTGLLAISCALAYCDRGFAGSVSKKKVTASIYADNFFDFFVNGKLVAADPRLLPHTAFQPTFRLKKGRKNVLAVYLKDNADPSNGLEYGARCIGDGGFRFRALDDSIISNSDWKCRTVHYGPINPEQCYGLGLDTTGEYSAFTGDDGVEKTMALARPVNPIPACRDVHTPVTEQQEGGFSYETCETVTFSWFDEQTKLRSDGSIAVRSNGKVKRAEWLEADYDDSQWDSAVEFPEVTVGWGAVPGTDSGPPFMGEGNDESWGPAAALEDELVGNFQEDALRPDSVEIPSELEWGDSKFIWRPSLRFDNQIVCRTTIYVERD